MSAGNRTRIASALAVVSMAALVFTAPSADAAWIAYHDFGATTGQASTGNITTHQTGVAGTSNNALDASAKALIKYSDGSATGVFFSVSGANGMDSRDPAYILPPAAGTPAYALFNVAGLNLNNGSIYEGGTGGSGSTTFTLTGLDPNELYDLAFYGDRNLSKDGLEEFTLMGADSEENISSTGIIDAFTTRQETRPNAADGNVIRWTRIDPGDDGIITVDVDPEFSSANNIVYLSAMRLEALPEPGTLALLGLGGLATLRRRRS
jgi:hypothetical protein